MRNPQAMGKLFADPFHVDEPESRSAESFTLRPAAFGVLTKTDAGTDFLCSRLLPASNLFR
jgi:hypothetical protein